MQRNSTLGWSNRLTHNPYSYLSYLRMENWESNGRIVIISLWNGHTFAAAKLRKPQSKAANIFSWTASWRELRAARTHSAKWSNVWVRWRWLTRGKSCPKSCTAASITATPNGSGPGGSSPVLARNRQQGSCSRAPDPAALWVWS